MAADHTHEIAHLLRDGSWCSFKPVVVNPLDSTRTITILECQCEYELTVRLVTRTSNGSSGRATASPTQEGEEAQPSGPEAQSG
jgi:hypothetical protein